MIVQGTLLQGNEGELVELVAQKEGWKEGYVVTRPDEMGKLYDLRVEGTNARGHQFSALLIRAAIGCLVPWTTKEVAAMTDHPSMAIDGDWSAVRDTSDVKLEAIFNKYIIPILHPPIQRVARAYTQVWLNDKVKETMRDIKAKNKKAKLSDWAVIIDAHGKVTLNVEYYVGSEEWREAKSVAL